MALILKRWTAYFVVKPQFHFLAPDLQSCFLVVVVILLFGLAVCRYLLHAFTPAKPSILPKQHLVWRARTLPRRCRPF